MSTTLPHRPSTNGSSQDRGTSFASFPASGPSSIQSNNNGLRKLASQASPRPKSHGSSRASLRPLSAESSKSIQTKLRRCRSQYPADSPEPHVEYILVASFHVDRGPIMEHQYPNAISGDEHMLAELMLPDQTHVRSQDWTIFFLHKDAGPEEDNNDQDQPTPGKGKVENGTEGDGQGENLEPSTDDDEDDEDESGEGPPLMYVLNLVNTKQDTSAKRYVLRCFSLQLSLTRFSGAVVKAMAICTRHSFLHIYKVRKRIVPKPRPLLLTPSDL